MKRIVTVAASLLLSVSSLYAANTLPLRLLKTTPLPAVTGGDFDHFAVDHKNNRLYVVSEDYASIEMFDLKSGEHLKSIPGFKTSHSLAFVPEKDELLVADGGDSALILVSAEDYHRIDRIQLIDGSATTHGDSPDAGYYDAANRLYYVGNGGISANMESSKISIYSVDQNKLIGDIDVPTNNVEAMGIANDTHRLFVNMRDHHEVGIFDLNTKQMIRTFTVDGMNRNTSLIVDPKSKRVFVAGRAPGILYVFDEEGKQITQMSIIDVNDDMNFDPIMKRLYISGSQGPNVIHQDTPDTYTVMADIPTNGGKTSTYVPSVHQLYVIHPKTSIDGSGLMVFHVNN